MWLTWPQARRAPAWRGARGTLPARDRELCILRTCARCGAEYECGVHAAAFARTVGLSDEEVRGTLGEREWAARDAPLLDAVDELHERATVSDETFARLRERYSDEQLLELFALVGFYQLRPRRKGAGQRGD